MRYLFFDEFEDVAIFVTRGFLAAFAVIMLVQYFRSVRFRALFKMIPLAVRTFTVVWLSIWGSMAVLVFLELFQANANWSRALYGSSFFGAMWGMAWCIWCLSKPEIAQRIIKTYNETLSKEVHRQLVDEGDA